MNKTKYILFAVLAILMVACNGKKEEKPSETHIVSEPVATKPDTMKMMPYTKSDVVTINNTQWTYTYTFSPSATQPIVVRSTDSKYYDNTLTLTIKNGTTTLYNHTFTKASFKRFIPEELYPTIVLMGINFNYNKQDLHDKFYFVASVGDPEDEEYHIPIDVTIDTKGELYLDKFVDTQFETEEQSSSE